MPAHWRKGLAFILSLVLWGGLQSRVDLRARADASAQDNPPPTSQMRLYPLDLSAFPQVSAYLDVFDASGNFIHQLQAQEVQVMENNQALAVGELQELQPGVQFALVVAYGPALGIRDGLGRSRYDYLLENIQGWEWFEDEDNPDDLSLVLEGGPQAVHLGRPADLLQPLLAYTVDPRQATPGLQALSRAISVVMDAPERPGMDRAVLFVTPPQSAEAIVGLQSLAAQAIQAGIRIFVWLVAAPEEVDLPANVQLRNLAVQTGGSFFHYTGVEAVPQIESYLAPLRPIYQLTYTSQITASGVYSVTASVQRGEQQIASAPQSLDISLQPPNVIFVGLPARLQRQEPTPPAETAGTATVSEPVGLQPAQQQLEVLVEFPDGHPRPVSASALLVDGTVIARNQTEPFQSFTWDLSQYNDSASHQVQAVITDTLGLRGSSMEMPVEIVVSGGSSRLVDLLPERGIWFLGVFLILAAGAVVLVLVISGRLRPYHFSRALQNTRPSATLPHAARQKKDSFAGSKASAKVSPASPTTEATLPSRAGWITRFSRASQRPKKAEAYLMPISESDASHHEAPIAITADEIIFGSDPLKSTWTIHNPALDPIHARLRHEANAYRLYDEGSTAGTWLNYQPVPPQGAILRHGDLVHLGLIGFRFTSRNPKDMRKPIIIDLEKPQ